MNKFFSLSILICFLHLQALGQSLYTTEAYTKQLLTKGIIPVQIDSEISTNDKALLLQFNFNAYRNYKSRIKIQLERGPLIELWSLCEMQEQGLKVETEFIERKKNELPEVKAKYELILKLNIGMGYVTKPYGERYN
ncbi:MAG: hypothetical protein NTY88_14060 [Bacteroidetes bacterium]|nr:hypothetical protein [Bacteroidota bacterium]